MRTRSLSGLVIAGLIVAGLALLPAAAEPAGAQGVTPGQVEAAIAGLDALVDRVMTETGVPGLAIAVVYRDQAIYLRGHGVRKAGTAEAVSADTVFQLASLSKPIAATVVAALVGDGFVTWDDRIIDHDPRFRLSDPWVSRRVTLRDMFAHRSGLPAHAGDLLEDLGYDRAAVLHRLRYQRPASSFRSAYAYTNFGLTAAAVAAARTTGLTWEDLSAARLYQPLGMTSTSSRYADFVAAANRAPGHVLLDGRWVARYQRNPDAQSPAGGVSSTARDLAQWLRLQLGAGRLDGRRIVAAEALAETHRPQIVSQAPSDPATERAGFYGLGWNVSYDDRGQVILGHSGAFSLGAATSVLLLPSHDIGIVVLTNSSPVGVPEAITASFADLVKHGAVQHDYLAIFGPVFAEQMQPPYGAATNFGRPPAQPSAARPAGAYLGTYHNKYFGEAEVAVGPAGLVLRLGPQPTDFPLSHWDGDTFVYQPPGENAAIPSAVTFLFDRGSTAGRVVIENLNIHGEGVFTRAFAGK